MSIIPLPHQRLPRYFTQDQLQHFFASISDSRDRALFALMYHHGLRVGEVLLLQRGDVDLARGRILIRRLKGGYWSEQFLFAETTRLLGAHLERNDAPLTAPLFAGRGGSLRRRQIQSRFARYRDSSGLPRRLTTHSLRHSIATHMLDAGAGLELVQDHLGHRSIRSTAIYARISDRHRLEAFRRLQASPWILQTFEAPSFPPPLEIAP